MDSKKQQAQSLYMQGMTHKDIAASVGVSERTIFTWIHQYAWNKLRLAAYQAPATIADNLCSQLVELQNSIARREPGKRYPTAEEAEITRKLIASLDKMKKSPSLSQNMQVLETFRNYMRPVDKAFTRDLGHYIDRFLSGKTVNGYAPYQVEYGIDPIGPMTQFYDEVDEEENGLPAVGTGSKTDLSAVAEAICPNANSCLHLGNCTYPHCQHPERYKPQPDPISAYTVPSDCYPIQYTEPISYVEAAEEPNTFEGSTETNGSDPATGKLPSRFWEGRLDEATAESDRGGYSAENTTTVTSKNGSNPATCLPVGTVPQYRNEGDYKITLPETHKNITPQPQPRKRYV
jgi:DNA-binding XRE family transcriptional regulator